MWSCIDASLISCDKQVPVNGCLDLYEALDRYCEPVAMEGDESYKDSDGKSFVVCAQCCLNKYQFFFQVMAQTLVENLCTPSKYTATILFLGISGDAGLGV